MRLLNRLIILLVAGMLLVAAACPVSAESRPLVVFANPGAEDDAFFGPMDRFMRAAARDLGFELVSYYGNRNHVVIDDNVEAIFRRKLLPDYLISMNARGSGKTSLDLAEAAGVKTIFVNQSFLGDMRASMGLPGEQYKQWLFEFLPDDTHAGYLLAKSLIEDARAKGLKGKDGFINIIAISGVKESYASILREKGLMKAVEEYPDVRVLQLVHAGWKRDRAHELSKGLLERYPDASVIWSASDLMGVGAVDGMRETGKRPGVDAVVGGVDWAVFAMDMVAQGDFTSTIGGHFMDGGWALVMLYDQLHGFDIPTSSMSSFSSLTRKNVNAFRARFGTGNWDQIDFRKFSKHHNPKLKEYDFSLDAILRQFPR